VGRTLAGGGWVEVVTFPFVGDADLDALGLSAEDPRREVLLLSNPLSNEAPAMTTTLLPGLLRTAARNVGHGTPSVAIFETAAVTRPAGEPAAPILPVDRRPTAEEYDALLAAVPAQPLHLGLVATGEAVAAGWWGPGRHVEWSDPVDAVRLVGEALGLDRPAPSFSAYPVAKEDVALVVDASVPAADVEAALREGAGELLESIRLFDVYTGDQAGEGRKSLAYALRFRAADRTLKEGETAEARDAAVRLAAERTGAVQRT
jgi:phenylalanyl-tRNA synthetase beta chain